MANTLLATEKQVKKLIILMQAHCIDRNAFKARMGVKSTKEFTQEQISRMIDHYENLPVFPGL